MRYLVIVEKGPTSWGAYAPDIPGCGVVGGSRAEVMRLIREAIPLHLECLREDGLPISEPASEGDFVDVPAA